MISISFNEIEWILLRKHGYSIKDMGYIQVADKSGIIIIPNSFRNYMLETYGFPPEIFDEKFPYLPMKYVFGFEPLKESEKGKIWQVRKYSSKDDKAYAKPIIEKLLQ